MEHGSLGVKLIVVENRAFIHEILSHVKIHDQKLRMLWISDLKTSRDLAC